MGRIYNFVSFRLCVVGLLSFELPPSRTGVHLLGVANRCQATELGINKQASLLKPLVNKFIEYGKLTFQPTPDSSPGAP